MRLDPTATGFVIDAADLGPLFEVPPGDVQRLMREGRITSRCERGQDEDTGRHRVTFRYGTTRLRFIVDDTGEVILRTRITIAPRPGATSAAEL